MRKAKEQAGKSEMARLLLKLPHGQAAFYKAEAKRLGYKSFSAYVSAAIELYFKKHVA